MSNKKYIYGAALLLLAASCAQDEVELNKIASANAITYRVDAGKMSRATSAYSKGGDIQKIKVSAWTTAPAINEDNKTEYLKDEDGNLRYPLPGYGSPNTGNAEFFVNDVLTRKAGNGNLFTYTENQRYWPINNEILDFYAVVDNEKLGEFSFTGGVGKPGIDGIIKQGGITEMPDMLYATCFDQRLEEGQKSKNVDFDFKHAFAKVIVSAEVKNENIRVIITDMDLCGIAKEGIFNMPYKSGEGSETIINDAFWTVSTSNAGDHTDITNLMALNNSVLLDLGIKDKETGKQTNVKDTLVGKGDKKTLKDGKTVYDDLLVIPSAYDGRNGSDKIQTYIRLKAYVYNKADAAAGFNEKTDIIVFPKDGTPTPTELLIPIEFNWKMGTVNKYNITFDCGNGGSNTTNPNDPGLVRIGYEVEVNDWVDGQDITFEEGWKEPEE